MSGRCLLLSSSHGDFGHLDTDLSAVKNRFMDKLYDSFATFLFCT